MADSDPVFLTQRAARNTRNVVRKFGSREFAEDATGRDSKRLVRGAFWVRVTGSEQDDDDQWRHTAVEIIKNDVGDDWVDQPDGRTAEGDSNGTWLYVPNNGKLADDTKPVLVLAIDFPDPETLEDEGGPSRVVEWWVISTPGAIDLLQDEELIVASTPFLNISALRGTADIIEVVAETIDDRAGGSIVLKAAPSQYMGHYWDGTNWVHDYLRAH